ncbi:hypothetical protein GLI01_36250 [Gluconacetobacter liquefaciens]|uniref:packaged DNA stabilization protein n=1 Tax=Gluconacetobacter liquefaciens TaxID=89584 RepID=UPI001142B72C|nr:packaged DNA stabilization protein [Gluconacetobacter liquefaciens]GEB39590.1 hypothetical protein GLI01_36250 [Gluconacetobacter liquefaciens]
MAVQQVAFAAQSYQAHSVALDAQRCVNFYAEYAPKDAKTPVPVWGCPGMVAFAQCGDGPVWGMCVMGGALYVVSGQALYRVEADGAAVELGATWVTGPVSMDTNGTDLVWVDGETGWSYSVAGGVQRIADENFYPADSVVYFDTYFVFNRAGTQQFFLSPQEGVTPFDGTMFASKEATADPLLAIVNSHEQLYLFGAARTEVWYDAGNAAPSFPFQRFDGAFIQRGIAGPHAHCLEDNTVFFLGDDGMFYRLAGYQPQRISTHAVEGAWQAYPTRADARCFSYTLEGHKFVTLLFPSAAATWVYDVATGLWHERESWTGDGADSSIGRWRANCALMVRGRVLVGDCLSGVVGVLNPLVYTELGATMRGLLAAPPVQGLRERVFMRRFELDVETGVGLPGTPAVRSVAYQPRGVEMTTPAALVRAGAPEGMAPGLASLLVSLWVDLPEDGAPRGLVLGNGDASGGQPGFFIGVANDGTLAGAQIVVRATDGQGQAIVTATYAFAGWGAGWVNLILSLSPGERQVQLYADGVALVPVSVAWSSAAPIGNPAGQGWRVAPWNGGEGAGLLAAPQFGGHTAGSTAVYNGWSNTSCMPDRSGNMISLGSGAVNAVSPSGSVVWVLAKSAVQADILTMAPGLDMLNFRLNAVSVLLLGQYLVVGVDDGAVWEGIALYQANGEAAPGFLGFVYNAIGGPGPIYGANQCFLAGSQTINDPILSYQIDYPAVPRVVLVFPSIAQIIGGAARVGGLNGLYPRLGSTVAWAACRVPVIKYAYPAQLGTHLLIQSGYNGNVGFFLPDGQGGTNHYLYFSRGDMAANAVAGGNANPEVQGVIGPACPHGAMVRIAMGVVNYDALAAQFAGNGLVALTGTLPMYSIDNANWIDADGAVQIPFADEYAFIADGQAGGTDVYGGQPGLTPIGETGDWLVSFLLVGLSDSAVNRGNASMWDTVRVFRYSAGRAVQIGAPVSGEAYAATDWAGYTIGPWSDGNAVAYVSGGEVTICGNMRQTAVGSYPVPAGTQYQTRFGRLDFATARVADLFVAAPEAFVDLSVAANRGLFLDAAGGARYLSSDGSEVLGVAPPVFLTVQAGAPVAAFADNGGSGGGFAVTGRIVPAGSDPPGSVYAQGVPAADASVGVEPRIMLDWSDDGARTWSTLRLWRSMGQQGTYRTRLRWLKLGQARQRVLRLQVTDPVRRNLIGFYLDTETGMG